MSFRADGKRLKHFDPMYTVAAHVMSRRSDAMNMITIDIPLEPLHRYINQKRNEQQPVSHLALILAAFVRTLAAYPELNRFVVNKRLYARNEVQVGMVVLKNTDSNGTMSKIQLQPDDTVFDVNRKINEYIESNRNTPDDNATERLLRVLLKVPGLLSVGVILFKWMDKHGLLPKSIINASPFHATLTITNLASIKTNHIYHHCYDFGTTSMVLAMGNPREIPRRRHGEIEFVRCMPIGIVMDERICSGHEYAIAFRTFRKLMENPALLEEKPAEVKTDAAL